MGSVLPDALSSSDARERAYRYLDQVADLGCLALDTAASYQLGGTERLLGHWLSTRRIRERVFLISKGAHPIPVVRPNRLTPHDLTADLDSSLQRLRTERIDLYLVHRDSPSAPLEPILETLVGFVRQGKIGAFGVSNWTYQRIAALDALARTAGVTTLAASSPHFSLVDWVRTPWPGSTSIAGEANRAARAYYQERQLPVLAWSPLGRGFFSPGSQMNKADRIYGSAANGARRQRAERLAQRYQRSAAQIALAYLFSQPFPVSAVVSSTSIENMRLNLGATTLHLSPSEVRWLECGDSASAPGET